MKVDPFPRGLHWLWNVIHEVLNIPENRLRQPSAVCNSMTGCIQLFGIDSGCWLRNSVILCWSPHSIHWLVFCLWRTLSRGSNKYSFQLTAPPQVRKWLSVSGCCLHAGHSEVGQSPARWSCHWVGKKLYIHWCNMRWWLSKKVMKALPNSVHAMDTRYIEWRFSHWVRCFVEASNV